MASISNILILSLTLSVLAHFATGIRYLALGDSYAAGIGSGGFSPDSTETRFPDFDRCCFRRGNAYPVEVSKDLRTTFFDFRACSGAVAIGPGNSVLESQLRSPPANIDLISVTIGGNDIGFIDIVTSCLTSALLPQKCLDAVADARRKIDTELGPRLRILERRLRQIYPSSTKIVFTGYPIPYPSRRRFFGNPICQSHEIRLAINAAAEALNKVIRSNVQNFAPVSFERHEICRVIQWFNRVPSGAFALRQVDNEPPRCSALRNAFIFVGGSYHPNRFGQREYAKQVVNWYRRHS